MPYSRNNYSFVVDSSFQPFSMQEMLTPLTMYKDAYDQAEAAYQDLSDKSDEFKYLSETLPKESKARQIYEGYANYLSDQAKDLAQHGLSMGNRRALTNLKRRYQGEIGRLMKADEKMKKEQELRRNMASKDGSVLYATNNLNIDDFLDESTPNLYNISGNELYARGAQTGKSTSSRYYSADDDGRTLGGYYRKWKETMGLSPESISKFMQSDAVQQEVDKILDERGVLQNLSGDELRRARQSVLNGIYDGIVYQESVKPYSDQGVLTAAQQLQRDNMEFQRAISGYERVGNEWRYNGDRDLERQRIEAQANARVVNRGNPNILGQSDANNTGSSNQTIRIAWNGNNYEQPRYLSGDETAQGISLSYSELPEQQRALVKQLVGSGNENFYTYYYERPNNTGLFSDVIDSSAGTIYAVPINIAGPSNTGGNAATTPNTTSGSTSINGTDDSDHMDLGGR